MHKDVPDLMKILWNSVGNLYWKDLQGRYLGCNKNAQHIFDTPVEQIIGKTDRELLIGKLSDEKILILEQTDQCVMQTAKEKVLEEEGIDKEGKPAFYITTKHPLYNQQKEVIGVIGTSLDITRQKLAEINDYIISQVPGNVYWKDKDGHYLGCNETFAKVVNLQSPQEVIGKNDYDFFLEPEYVERIIQVDKQVISSNKSIVLEEVGTGLNRQHATYMTKKSPLINKEGLTVGVIGMSVDITKEKQAEMAKQEFINSMAHDIRTPFSGLYGLTELLYEQEKDVYKKEMLGYVLESAESLLVFLNQTLEMLRIDKFGISKTSFNIHTLMNDILKLVKPSLELKSLKLTIDCPDTFIKTDHRRVECILMNLIGNAIKFTAEGNITVRVTVTPHFCCEVKDTGIGIPNDKLETIFDKFYRVVPTYQESKFSGVGLGLYVSRLFARELQGDITVHSEVGKGTCFSFFLPNS